MLRANQAAQPFPRLGHMLGHNPQQGMQGVPHFGKTTVQIRRCIRAVQEGTYFRSFQNARQDRPAGDQFNLGLVIIRIPAGIFLGRLLKHRLGNLGLDHDLRHRLVYGHRTVGTDQANHQHHQEDGGHDPDAAPDNIQVEPEQGRLQFKRHPSRRFGGHGS